MTYCRCLLRCAFGFLGLLLVISAILVGGNPFGHRAFGAEKSAPPKLYTHLLDPREHPDYSRYAVRPPDWDTFGNRTHMTSLRGVPTSAEMDKYVKEYELGDVLWPGLAMLSAPNLEEMVDEIRQRGLFLFDIWGYVPATDAAWGPSKLSPQVQEMFEAKLGPRWLGMDIGEQDGRYIGGYAPQMCPASASRFEQYANFQRHFERMANDWGNKVAALVSLNFGHYLVKEGIFTSLGAETAQALPNCQLYYAFIRGACKQYGLLWFGNASIFNRWGYKMYDREGGSGADTFGPTHGTSLSLLKRLIYSHVLYNSAIVGFENAWFDGERLSPIGRIQQSVGRWLKENGQPGTMLTPVAVMTDFFAGWSFPRHLYSDKTYRVWGNLPYGPGDHLTDGVLDRLYPGYEKSSYYHDESGFLTATPFGDGVDCLLSDAPVWLLKRYPTLVITGELAGGVEIRDKLTEYVQSGGHLVITAGNLAKMPGGLLGSRVTGAAMQIAAGQQIAMPSATVAEDAAFELLPLETPANGQVLARCDKTPVAVEMSVGNGRMTVLASPFGIASQPATQGKVASPIDGPLAKPFPLLRHVSTLLDEVFREQTLFEAGPDLHVIVCRKQPGAYTIGVFNNAYRPMPFEIVSHCGRIESTRELPIDASERGAVGQLPPGVELASIGENGPKKIAGGDVRIFEVRLAQETVEEIPHSVPPARPQNRILPLRKGGSIQEEILARPTFFQHFDGVLVDWRYLHDRSMECIQREAGWINRQKLRVVVDLASGFNLFPDLRLVNSVPDELAASMAIVDDVLAKTAALGGRDLVLALHRQPEVNYTAEQTRDSMDASLREICRRAKERNITVYLRMYPERPLASLPDALATLQRLNIENLRLAASTGLSLTCGGIPPEYAAEAGKQIGLWMAGGPAVDLDGRLYDVHRLIADEQRREQLGRLLGVAPAAPVVFDAIYDNQDSEYLDAVFVERLLQPPPK